MDDSPDISSVLLLQTRMGLYSFSSTWQPRVAYYDVLKYAPSSQRSLQTSSLLRVTERLYICADKDFVAAPLSSLPCHIMTAAGGTAAT